MSFYQKTRPDPKNHIVAMLNLPAKILLLAAACPSAVKSFGSVPTFRHASFTRLAAGADPVDISEFPAPVVYTITSAPPLGIILTEFRSNTVPYLTPTIVSDVSEGYNAAKKGVRNGDVLIGIGGSSMLEEGIDFEAVMGKLGDEIGSEGSVTATFFRGSGFGGQSGFDGLVGAIVGGEDAEEAMEEDVIDEVDLLGGGIGILSVDDMNIPKEKEVGIGELFGSLFKETAGAVKRGLEEPPAKAEKEKKKGGFFGFLKQETVQMEEDPNQYANKVDDDVRDRD